MKYQIVELSLDDVHMVSGGVSNDAAWGASIGSAVAFVGMAIAISNPVGAGVFAAASLISSGISVSYV